MTLNDIYERAKSLIASSTTINSFAFDDLTVVNENRGKQYPLFLLKPPTKYTKEHITNKGSYKTYTFSGYIMDTFHQIEKSVKSEAQKWSELDIIGEDYIRSLQDRTDYFMLDDSLSATFGHYEHNEELMVVAYEFQLSVYTCN